VASESKWTLAGLQGMKDFQFVIGKDVINNGDSVGVTTIEFSLTRAIAGPEMTEEELVDFETKITQAVQGTAGYSNVEIARVGNDLFVRDAEGRSIDATTALNFVVCEEALLPPLMV
jgi:hypothetical protein